MDVRRQCQRSDREREIEKQKWLYEKRIFVLIHTEITEMWIQKSTIVSSIEMQKISVRRYVIAPNEAN